MRHWLRLPREVEAAFLMGGGFEEPDVVECVPVHGREDGTRRSLRTLPTQSIPSFRVSMIRYEMYIRQSYSLLSSPKRYGRPDPRNQHTQRPVQLLLQRPVTGHMGGPVLSCMFPRCCFRSYRTCFMLPSHGSHRKQNWTISKYQTSSPK